MIMKQNKMKLYVIYLKKKKTYISLSKNNLIWA